MNIPEGWKRIDAGDSIKEYLTVLKVGKGDYEVTATHGGLIAKLPSGGFEFRPDKHPGLDHFFVFSGKTFATGWRFAGMRCTHFSNGEPMGSSFQFGVTNTSEEAPQPVAWMSRCIKGDRMGTVEQCEPDGPNNREYWSAAFPVYTHADAAECDVCKGSGVLPGLTVEATKCSYCSNGWETIAKAEAELRLADQKERDTLRAELAEQREIFVTQEDKIDALRAEVKLLKSDLKIANDTTVLGVKMLAERDALLRKVRAYLVSQDRITAETDAILSASAAPAKS